MNRLTCEFDFDFECSSSKYDLWTCLCGRSDDHRSQAQWRVDSFQNKLDDHDKLNNGKQSVQMAIHKHAKIN